MVKTIWAKKDGGATVFKELTAVGAEIESVKTAAPCDETAADVLKLSERINKLNVVASKDVAVKERLTLFGTSVTSLMGTAVRYHVEKDLVPYMTSVLLHANGGQPCPAIPAWNINLLKGTLKTDSTTDSSLQHTVFRQCVRWLVMGLSIKLKLSDCVLLLIAKFQSRFDKMGLLYIMALLLSSLLSCALKVP